jgi:DNA/RNA-binding domain of Phe-tRNA-synthetase-like protein
VATSPEGATYVFNQGGQTIDLGGLVCLCDEVGPCANAVKDAQRTKTRPETTRVLAVVWGCDAGQPGRTQRAADLLAASLQAAGAAVDVVPVEVG